MVFNLPMIRTGFVVRRIRKGDVITVKPVGFLTAMAKSVKLTKFRDVNRAIMAKLGSYIDNYAQSMEITQFTNSGSDAMSFRKKQNCYYFIRYLAYPGRSGSDFFYDIYPAFESDQRFIDEFVMFWLASFTQMDAPSIVEEYRDEDATIEFFDTLKMAKNYVLSKSRSYAQKGQN